MGSAHSHSHRLAADRISAAAAFSLLRLSAFVRLGGALAIVAALWASVYWALH
jgi:hypothetical protein